MFKIEIETVNVDTKSGTAARTGKPYSIREQTGFAYIPDSKGQVAKHPKEFKFALEDGVDPYQPGAYLLSPTSVYVGRFGNLEIGRVRLVRTQAQASVKAA